MRRQVITLIVLVVILLVSSNNGLSRTVTAASVSPAVDGNGTIATVFGNGVSLPFSNSDFGKPATQVPSSNVLHSGLAVGADGTLYFSMPGRVVKVGPDGIVRPVVSICTSGNPHYPECLSKSTGDGGPALEATVSANVAGLSIGKDGSIYIADAYKVRRIGPSGLITTIAGSEQGGFSGDGGPATQATFGQGNFFISDVDVADDGTVYITDTGNHRIRKVSPNGIVTTIAGKAGNPPNCWDIPKTGTATDIFLFYPTTSTIGPDGALYVSSTYCSSARRIINNTSTLIVEGFDSNNDGIAAFANQGNGITFGGDGTLYLSYYYSNADNVVLMRKNDDSTSILGTGYIIAGKLGNGWHFSGDGGAAKNAELAAPSTLATGPDGSIYVLDALNYRIRRIASRYTTTISPAAGGTLNTANKEISIQFPSGAVGANTDISLTPSSFPTHPTTGYRPTRYFFSLLATSNNSSLSTFNKPFTLTLNYQDYDLKGAGIINDSRLGLFFWNGVKWQSLLPCAGCSFNRSANRVTIVLDHFTDFAFMELAPTSMVYIPRAQR